MNLSIRLFFILFLILLILASGILTYGLIWTEFIVETDFETSGTGFNKTIIWMILIISTLLSFLIENINSLKKQKKESIENKYDKSDFELAYTIRMSFGRVARITFSNTFKEPVFYLLTGIFVLPLFQDKEFIENFNIVNVSIMTISIVLGMILLSFLHSLLNYISTYGSGRELNLIVSHMGLYIKDKKITRHLAWSKIKQIQESDLFLFFKINRFYKIGILKELFDNSDLEEIRRTLIQK